MWLDENKINNKKFNFRESGSGLGGCNGKNSNKVNKAKGS